MNFPVVVAAVLPIAVCLAACQYPTTEPDSQPIRVVRLLHTWGIDPSETTQMQAVLAGSLKDMHVELNRADASLTALMMLRRRDVDAVFTMASLAYMAMTGELAQIPEPSDDFRAIAALPSRAVQVVVGPRSSVTSFRDLRGKRVSIGPPGSRAALVAELLLRAFRIPLQDLRVERLQPVDAAHKIITGELDAFFWAGSAHAEVDEAVRHGARILEFSEAEVDLARTNYPLLQPTTIDVGSYSAVDTTIHTVGIDEILLCRKDLDEQLAHELTRAFVELVAGGHLEIEPLSQMNLSAASSTAIPLHPGAARYYRERELLP